MKLKIVLKRIKFLFKETVKEFIGDNAIKLSAALSYYTIFSLPPLLIIIISLSGFFYGAEAVSGELYGQINGLVGAEAALQIQEIIKNVELSDSSTFATIIGVIMLLVGASGVFSEMQDSINYIWGIKAKPNRGLIKFIKNRLMSFSMVASVGFILLVGLIVNSVMDVLYSRFTEIIPINTFYLFYVANLFVVFIIITLLFLIIFKILPDGKIVFFDCFVGAAFTSLLFMIGKFAIGAYLGNSAVASAYGAAGSVILIMVWVYYSAFIFYFGAEFTKVYARSYGKNIRPNDYTIQIVKPQVENE